MVEISYISFPLQSFKALRDCCEPSMFSLDRLALSVVTDPRATLDGLLRARDHALLVVAKEKMLRAQLAEIGELIFIVTDILCSD